MSALRNTTRVLMGVTLAAIGVSHLTIARRGFQAQVPDWVPGDPDIVVVGSGIAEIALGGALILAPRSAQRTVGTIAAAFFVAVFPGNISQSLQHRDAFGLDTDTKRTVRLFFQPVLVALALWARPRRSDGGSERQKQR